MIYGVTYSSEAKTDLAEMLEFIAGRSSLVTAERFTDAVVKACESLGLAPSADLAAMYSCSCRDMVGVQKARNDRVPCQRG